MATEIITEEQIKKVAKILKDTEIKGYIYGHFK